MQFPHALRLGVLFLLFSIAPTVLAQTDCPTFVKEAFERVDSTCQSLARNEVCYGHIDLRATLREGVPADVSFENLGDTAELSEVESLDLSAMSLEDDRWGIALMRVQANLPDTLPGQAVVFLVFGDVQLVNEVEPTIQLPITATISANIRRRPTTTAENVIASLSQGSSTVANARLEDSSWLRVTIDDVFGAGWISADFVEVDGDIETLPVVEAEDLPYTPMQAFQLKTGLVDETCSETPTSGILVQSPESHTIRLRVNGVDLLLGSTALLQTDDQNLDVYLLEGHSTVSAGGETQVVLPGTVVSVPLNEDGSAPNGEPAKPEPYNADAFENLPLEALSSFEEFEIAPALTEAEIEALLNPPTPTPTLTPTALPTFTPTATVTVTSTPTFVPTEAAVETAEPVAVVEGCLIEVAPGQFERTYPDTLYGANGGNFEWMSPTHLINHYSFWLIWQDGVWATGYYGDCSPLGVGSQPPADVAIIN